MVKRVLYFFILLVVVILCPYFIFAQGGNEENIAKQFLNKQKSIIENGILVDPGYQTVCFDSTRPGLQKGTAFDPLPPGATVKVTITGECPYDSGCELYRTAEGNMMTVVTGSRKPSDPKPSLDPNTPYELGQHIDKKKPDRPTVVPILGRDGKVVVIKKGPVNMEIVERDLVNHNMYFYIGRGKNESTEGETQTIEGPTTQPGESSSLQQGQLGFNSTTVSETPTSGESRKCKFIVWDPYGRVFDSKSLEPIPNALVTLIDAKTNEPAVQLDANFAVTLTDGLFNILVGTPGMYKIRVNPPNTHQVDRNATLATGYDKMYFNLYKPEDEYEEKYNVPTHHDIAVAPVTNPYIAPYVESVKLTTGVHMGSMLYYMGRVTHPLAHVCLFGEQSRTNYGCDRDDADSFGIYQIFIDAEIAPLFERLVPVAVKYNQEMVSDGPILEHALKQGMGFEPLFGFLDGYARDENGAVLPKARVQIFESETNTYISESIADAIGYFRLTSEKLPISGYHLVFTPSRGGGAILKTTSAFAEDNKEYLASRQLDLVKPLSAAKSKISSAWKFTQKNPTGIQQIPKNQPTQQTVAVWFFIGTLVILGIGAGVIGFGILHKKQQ